MQPILQQPPVQKKRTKIKTQLSCKQCDQWILTGRHGHEGLDGPPGHHADHHDGEDGDGVA